jgi:hypothetical protein
MTKTAENNQKTGSKVDKKALEMSKKSKEKAVKGSKIVTK